MHQTLQNFTWTEANTARLLQWFSDAHPDHSNIIVNDIDILGDGILQ